LSDSERAGLKLVFDEFKKSGGGKVIMDLYYSSNAIYISFGLSFVWSLIFIYLMSMFAETLAWCCVVLIQLGLIAFTVLSYFQWKSADKDVAEAKAAEGYDSMSEAEKKTFDSENPGPGFYMGMLIIFGLLSLTFLCMIWCGKASLQRAIDVIDASADFIAHNKRVIFVPILHFFIQILACTIWLGAFICVASLNEIKPDNLSP